MSLRQLGTRAAMLLFGAFCVISLASGVAHASSSPAAPPKSAPVSAQTQPADQSYDDTRSHSRPGGEYGKRFKDVEFNKKCDSRTVKEPVWDKRRGVKGIKTTKYQTCTIVKKVCGKIVSIRTYKRIVSCRIEWLPKPRCDWGHYGHGNYCKPRCDWGYNYGHGGYCKPKPRCDGDYRHRPCDNHRPKPCNGNVGYAQPCKKHKPCYNECDRRDPDNQIPAAA